MSASIGRSVTDVGFLLTSVAAGVALNVLGATHAVDSYDATLLGVAGILIGINVIAAGIWMSDNPAAARAICARQRGVLGVVMASSAVTAVATGAVDPLLCFGLLVLLLVGISLVMHGALGLRVG